MGFKNLHAYNLAMLAKQGWRLLTSPTSLIARLFKAVYFPEGSFLTAELGESPSFSWRSIFNARHVLCAGLLWRIGSGDHVRIWQDDWIPGIPAHSLHQPDNCIFQYVSDLIHLDTKTWNVQALHQLFSSEIIAIILGIPLRSRCSQDRLTWKLEKKGSFSVKSCYWIARDVVLGNSISSSSLGDPFLSLWKALWKAKVPGKVAICAWRACNNLLPTREKLSNKGYSGDMRCLLCSHSFEIGTLFVSALLPRLFLPSLLSLFI